MSVHETYGELAHDQTPAAEFIQLAIAARHAETMVLFNHKGASVEEAEKSAKAALDFIESHPGIALELVCVDTLRSICEGGLRTAQLQSA